MNKNFIYLCFSLLVFIPACGSQQQIVSGKNAVQKKDPARTINSRLENLELSDSTGKRIYLRDYLGKPVFLNFWATWCKPCKSEMESIQTIHDQFKDQIIFLLASNEDWQKINSFVATNPHDLNFVHLNTSFIDAYVVELPTTLLIDRNGQIVKEEEGLRIWTQDPNIEALKKLIKN